MAHAGDANVFEVGLLDLDYCFPIDLFACRVSVSAQCHLRAASRLRTDDIIAVFLQPKTCDKVCALLSRP